MGLAHYLNRFGPLAAQAISVPLKVLSVAEANDSGRKKSAKVAHVHLPLARVPYTRIVKAYVGQDILVGKLCDLTLPRLSLTPIDLSQIPSFPNLGDINSRPRCSNYKDLIA